jgi:transposase-like protein
MNSIGSAVVLEDRQRGVEVVAKATRRRFTAEYKLKVLREADACRKPGEIGALLRREGLYTSHLCMWRKQRGKGGLFEKKRGPVPKEKNPLATKVAALEKETRRLKARAERAEALVELQKKVSEILGIELNRNGEKD